MIFKIESFLRQIVSSFLKFLLEFSRDNPVYSRETCFFSSRKICCFERKERKEEGKREKEKIKQNDEAKGTNDCAYISNLPRFTFIFPRFIPSPVFTRPSNRTFCLIKSCDRQRLSTSERVERISREKNIRLQGTISRCLAKPAAIATRDAILKLFWFRSNFACESRRPRNDLETFGN